MPRVLHTSDLHGHYHRLEQLLGTIDSLDLWIDTGDFFPNKTRGDRRIEPGHQWRWATKHTRIGERLAKICVDRGITVLSVGGNHDYVSLSQVLRGAGMPEGSTYDLSDSRGASVTVCGLRFAGFREIPWIEGEWNGETPDGGFRELVDRVLDLSPGPDVLLTHAPASGILDDPHYRYHCGIPYLTQALMYRDHSIRYHLFGHVHEQGGQTVDRGGILFSNAAASPVGNLLEIT